MKKFVFIALLLAIINVHAQNYYYLTKTGTTSEYVFNNLGTYYWQGNLTGYPDTLISRTLPFSWTFYGQTVTTYKISDNGYITFDNNETQSNPDNEAIPSANAPKNAIFALWDALVNCDPNGPSDYTNLIHTWTYGTAPDRVHVIHWFRMFHEPYTNQNVSQFCFGLRIFESGSKKFDIVLDYNYLPSGGTVVPTTATIGCQNADASLGVMIPGSPNYAFPNISSANTDDVVFEFYEGVQPDYDLALNSITINDMANFNQENAIGGLVRNMGKQSITSFEINYHVDGNTFTKTYNVTINPGGEYQFKADPYLPTSGSGQYHEIVVWIGKLNGSQNDENNSNDTIRKSVFVNLGISAIKRTLIEEFTTVPCGFCPDGHLKLEEILNNYPNVIGVCHHAGFGTDAMTISQHSTYATDFADGAPTAAIDRHRFEGDAGNIAISRNIWESSALSMLNVPAPCRVQSYGSFDKSSGALNATVQVEFVDYALPGDLRITVFLVEDHVSEGTGTNWDQHSYYYNTVGHPFYQKGIYNGSYAVLPKYDHRHVSRAVISPVWGTSGVISSNPQPGELKTKNYSYTFPSNWNKDSVYLVAFVSYYNTDKNKRDVLNSFITRVVDMPAQAVGIEQISSDFSFSIFPNPVKNMAVVKFSIPENTEVSYEIYNLMGKKIGGDKGFRFAAGINELFVNTSELAIGTYILKINAGGNTYSSKIVKTE